MRKISKILAAFLLTLVLLFNTISCDILLGNNNNQPPEVEAKTEFYIDAPPTVDLKVGESLTLKLVMSDGLEGDVVWTSSTSFASVENGVVTALGEGVAVIKATLGNKTDRVIINIIDSNADDENKEEEEYIFGSEYSCITVAEALALAEKWTSGPSDESYYIIARIDEIVSESNGRMYISDDSGSIYVYKSNYDGGQDISSTDLAVGDMIVINGTLRNYKGTLEIDSGTILNHYTPGVDTPTKPNQNGNGEGGGGNNGGGNNSGSDVTIPGTDDPITSDPYVNVDKAEFYANYTPAISYMDAYYRSQHNLMSGSIEKQDQAPTVAEYQPKSNGKFIRNNVYIFSEDGNTYYVVDSYGEIAFEIYKGGAYVVLEEVAAYVFAFGEPPANHSASKSTRPSSSPWGIYLRVNNTVFSGSTSKYPYEPELPRISGCGGDLTYYEMDIGTTGTDCDPSYDICDYNDGYTITRGAARIVYSSKDKNGNKIIDLDERYVFYTYNHYNDFQEYLNYEGGWGQMFGNVTGGGKLSSKYDYNPTPYVQVVHAALNDTATVTVIYYYVPKQEWVA